MTHAWYTRSLAVWLLLLIATGISVATVEGHAFGTSGVRIAAGLSLALAFGKTLVIGREFMEIRGAPTALRISFTTWVLLFGSATIALAVQ